jgi:hypothetical protein
MQRDMDLVRQILLKVEEHPTGFAPNKIKIDGYTSEQIGYHAYIMGEAGLLNVIDVTTNDSSGPEAMIQSMTWNGHEFLEAAREPGRWKDAKNVVNKAGGASFEVFKAVLIELAKKAVGL